MDNSINIKTSPLRQFKILGHAVYLYNPSAAEVCINVPWTLEHNPNTKEELLVINTAKYIINYCVTEAISSPNMDVVVSVREQSTPK